jgi:ribose 5-phosphate isomerase A
MRPRTKHLTVAHAANTAHAAASQVDLDALGRHALRFVKPGQTIGLGTGRAAAAFIRALGASGLKVRGVATSEASAALARSLDIELVQLHDVARLDADFDGADEVDPRLDMIKGLGGALVREKIVAVSARRRIFLIGAEKLVKRLGARGNLPVEVVPFAEIYAAREISKHGLKPKLRITAGGAPYISDNGNLILDCGVAEIRNPARLERDLLMIAGVVGTGLFVAMADLVIVARAGGKIEILRRKSPTKS